MSKLPYSKGPIDKEYEFVMNCYGIGYDAANGVMLTNTPGVYDKSTVAEVKARFQVLKQIARKRAPSKLSYIERCENITLRNIKGQISDKEALRLLRNEAQKAGGDANLSRMTEQKINTLEMRNNSMRILPNPKPKTRKVLRVKPIKPMAPKFADLFPGKTTNPANRFVKNQRRAEKPPLEMLFGKPKNTVHRRKGGRR